MNLTLTKKEIELLYKLVRLEFRVFSSKSGKKQEQYKKELTGLMDKLEESYTKDD